MSEKLPIKKLIIFSIITFGIYEVYWFYRTWKIIKKHTNATFSPGWRTFGLFIPIYNLIRIDGMFRKDIELLRVKVDGEKIIKTPLFYGLVYVLFAASARLPDPFWLITFLSVLPLAGAQRVLNLYLDKLVKENVYCGKCGDKLDIDSKFCAKCGEKI